MNSRKIAVCFAIAIFATLVVAQPQEASGAQSRECTTVRPGPDWICVDGGWYPPGMPLPGGVLSPVPALPAAGCSTIQPGPDWTCVGGGWYPPGMAPPAIGSSVAPAAAAPAFSACTTVQPGPGWQCAGGGWLPPGMLPPAGTQAVPATVAPAATGCTTVQPGPDWSCVGGGWQPPGMAPESEPTATSWSAPASAALTSSTGGRLRVMTWNIHFGHGNTWGQAVEIANSGADVVLLQEASTWDEHMPSAYAERLRQLTGQGWQAVWSGTANPDCASGCQGNLILSRFPVLDSQSVLIDGTTISRATIDVGGVPVTVFNVHLEWYDTGKRSSQLLQFMDWSRGFGGPRVAGGDFNSWWGEWWISQMKTEYTDTWEDVTGSVEEGYTLNRAVRFDYLFRSHADAWRLIPTGVWVQWTSLSDHDAVVADYTVR